MNVRVLLILVAVMTMIVAWGGTAAATPYALVNPSFEDPPGQPSYWSGDPEWPDSVPDGQSTTYPTGWMPVYGKGNYGDLLVERNPTSAEFAGAGGDGTLPSSAAGSQACFNSSTFDNDICLLTDTYYDSIPITHGMTYTFTIAVGRAQTDPLGWFAGFSLLVVDGWMGELTNKEFDNSENPANGTFKDFTITFKADDYINGDAVSEGDPLRFGFLIGAGTYVDNARLDISVPEPSMLALLVSAFVGLGAYVWRKRK